MAGAQLGFGHQLLNRGRELEQPERVRDRGTALPHTGRDVLVGHVEVLDQLLVRGRLVDRVEVLALQVLDQRLLEHPGVGHRPHDGGNRLQTGPPSGPPAPFAGDQLEAALPDRSDEDRLEDAQLTHRGGERGQRLLVERAPGLERARLHRRHRDLLQRGARLPRHPGRDQGAQTPTQSAAARHHSPPWPARDRRSHPARTDRTR